MKPMVEKFEAKKQACEQEDGDKGTHVVYKKETGEKIGCTSDPDNYLTALRINVADKKKNEEIEIVELSAMSHGSVALGGGKSDELLQREEIWRQVEEQQLRESIRRMALIEKAKKQQILEDEKKLRKIIQRMILKEAQADPDESPHASTGINVLKNVLKKIVPIIQTDYKLMTTEMEQRISFRKHLVRGLQDAILSAEVIHDAETGEDRYTDLREEEMEEDIEVEVGEEPDVEELPDSGYIELGKKPEKIDTIEGEDKTGRDMAADTLERIEKTVLSAFEKLHDAQDQDDFKKYLSINLLLHMDRFESALTEIEGFEVPGYEEEKQELENEEEIEVEA
tara:strand:+ start:2506 stop:3522 length:1017 start_codon:yes stop_codon:yes gene_type:complete